MSRQEVAAAMAFFESCEDLELLRKSLQIIRPKAAQAVSQYVRSGREVPGPLDLRPADEAATQEESLRITRSLSEIGELQALARVIGRRFEQLQSA